MQDTKMVKIDLDELCSAMDESSYEHAYYLDLDTGEMLFISDYVDNEETQRPVVSVRHVDIIFKKAIYLKGGKQCLR